MQIDRTTVESIEKIGEGTFLLKLHSPGIARTARPGQFCNIKVSDSDYPLLRRPFSINDTDGDHLFFLFDIHGEGTRNLAAKRKGDSVELIGPLGNGFSYEGDFDTAVIVAGGLGTAPFPFLIKNLESNKTVMSLIGGRSEKYLITHGLKNIFCATDDGSRGFHGTVVDLLKSKMPLFSGKKIRIFACGPNPMLKALQNYSIENGIDCQISVECAMACGFGICQGCPVDSASGETYLLVCKDGPVFRADEVKL